MRVRGDEFSARLRTYADSTIQKIMDLKAGAIKERVIAINEIVATTDTEEEVVRKLKELQISATAKTGH